MESVIKIAYQTTNSVGVHCMGGTTNGFFIHLGCVLININTEILEKPKIPKIVSQSANAIHNNWNNDELFFDISHTDVEGEFKIEKSGALNCGGETCSRCLAPSQRIIMIPIGDY
jgi:hypothetical protein